MHPSTELTNVITLAVGVLAVSASLFFAWMYRKSDRHMGRAVFWMLLAEFAAGMVTVCFAVIDIYDYALIPHRCRNYLRIIIFGSTLISTIVLGMKMRLVREALNRPD